MTYGRLALALIVAPLAFVTPRFVNAQAADLIVTNARIYTVDENRPVVEAMAIHGSAARDHDHARSQHAGDRLERSSR